MDIFFITYLVGDHDFSFVLVFQCECICMINDILLTSKIAVIFNKISNSNKDHNSNGILIFSSDFFFLHTQEKNVKYICF